MGARPRVTYISWAESCSRSDHIARELGGRSHMVYAATFASRPATVLFKYALQWVRTARILRRERPDAVFIMAPPVFAALPAIWYAWRTGTHVVVDAHTCAFLLRRWRWFQWLQRAVCRRALTTLVTNDHLAGVVRAGGAHATVVPDVPVVFPEKQPFPRPAAFTVTAVCSFDVDEPLPVILEAATRLPDVHFCMTGRPENLPQEIRNRLPPNVELTGFLSTPVYGDLIAESDAVLDLTTSDHTMLRGAYEAIYQGTPVIVSDWPILRDHFPQGAIHVDNTADAVVAAIAVMRREGDDYRRAAVRLRETKLARWDSNRRALLDALAAGAAR
jgi:glycosyltransferase involved in cell wall biosynthesis